MNNFRTSFEISSLPRRIHLHDSIFSIGSCFADHIGNKLSMYKFSVCSNPFGVLFNPITVFEHLQNKDISSGYIQNPEKIYYNLFLHSEIAALSQTELEQKVEEIQKEASFFLQKSQFLIITLGTSYVYRYLPTQEIVANCHKLPQHLFSKELLSVEQILTHFHKLYAMHRHRNIILTLSPVRHTKDTIPLNSVSKAILRLACHQLAEQYPNVFYFPSYEILMDDLRDYRFYNADLIHPNEIAIDYIWNSFIQTCIDEESQVFIRSWEKISKSLQHHSFFPASESHQKFLRNLLQQLKQIKIVEVNNEIEWVEKQLQ